MEKKAFNIRFGYGEKEVTLTILPDDDYYKIIYYGGILGAVYNLDGEWDFLEVENLQAGDLPFYTPDLTGERLEIVLDENAAYAIGEEIEMYYNRGDES